MFNATSSQARIPCKSVAVVMVTALNFIEFCLDSIFWTVNFFVAEHMGVRHCEPVLLSKGLFCCHQGQGHSESSSNWNIIVSVMSSELLIPLQINLVWWYIIISESILWKDWIGVFRVKVIVMVQNFIEYLSVLYSQTRCVDVCLLITGHSSHKTVV